MVVKELVALLGVKADQTSFKKAEGGMGNLIAIAKKAAIAFAALKITQFIKSAVTDIADLGDQFDKMAKRSGFATAELQKFQHVAELSGASIQAVETVIKKLQQSQVEAADGTAEYLDEFKRLGLEVKEADGSLVNTQELFFRMADAMNDLETDAERTAVAMKLLGRGGTSLIPFFKEGTEGIKEMMQELEDLGGLMDDELVQASADFIDNQQRMTIVTRGLKIAIAKELLPIINESTDAFLKWWKTNGKLIRQRIGDVFSVLARTVGGVVTGVKGLVRLFVNILQKLPGVAKGVLAIGIAIKIVQKIIKMGPIGKLLLLITLIALIIDDFEVWRKGGKSVIGDLVESLDEMLDIDIVGWVTAAVEVFKDLWGGIKKGAGAVIQSILAIGKLLITVWDDPEKAWREFTHEMKLIWEELWDWTEKDGKEIVSWYEKFISALLKPFKSFEEEQRDILNEMFEGIREWAIKSAKKIIEPFEKIRDFLNKLLGKNTKVKIKNILDIPELKGKIPGVKAKWDPSRAQAPAGAGARAGAGAGEKWGAGWGVEQNTDVNVSVNASPGMSENEVAQLVAKEVSTVMDKRNRAAVRALTPAGAGGI